MRLMMLKVTKELLSEPTFRLPDGYRVTGRSYDAEQETYELAIRGPFPGVPGNYFDVHNVSAFVSRVGTTGSWQWTLNGAPVGPAISIELSYLAAAA